MKLFCVRYAHGMYVLTADQKQSRHSPDAVPAAIELLSSVPTVRAFERSAGDEIQGVLDSAAAVLQAAIRLSSAQCWHIGIGVGDIEQPLPQSARAGRGDAYLRAREAVEEAKRLRPSLVVKGSDKDTNALWRLLAAGWDRRSAQGWEAVFAMNNGEHSQPQVAASLGISQQALSERLLRSGWAIEQAVHPLACRLLETSDGKATIS